MSAPVECEDCGEEIVGQSAHGVAVRVRRYRCHHCGLLVCGWCMHHVHACGPGHSEKDCEDLKQMRDVRAKHGADGVHALLERKRARALLAVSREEPVHGSPA